MSAQGVDFLEVWIDENVGDMGQPVDLMKAHKLAKQLLHDAAFAGHTLADMDLEGYSIERYMLQAMIAPSKPPWRPKPIPE
jgi:hypothetical protein